MNISTFLSNLWKSLLPPKYRDLCRDNTVRKSALYFLTLLIIMSLITGILYIPILKKLPQEVQKEFSKINNINFNVDLSTNGQAKFGLLTIDMTTNRSLEGSGILIAKQRLEYKLFPFTSPKVISDRDFQELVNDPSSIQKLFKTIVIFLAPYLLILLFLYHLIKYLVLVLLISSFVIILIRTSKGDIDGKPVYKSGFFASIFLMLELPLQIYVESWTYNTLVPFLIFLIFLMVTIFYLRPEDLEKHENVGGRDGSRDKSKDNIFGKSSSKGKNDFGDDNEYVQGDVFAGTSLGK